MSDSIELGGFTFTRTQHYDRTYWTFYSHPTAGAAEWFDNTDETVRDMRLLAEALDRISELEDDMATMHRSVVHECCEAKVDLLNAVEFTQQYAGFPAIEGWTWWDAYRRWASPEDVARWEQWERERQEREEAKRNGGWVVVISDGHAGEPDEEVPHAP